MSNTKDLRNFVEKWVKQEVWQQSYPLTTDSFVRMVEEVATEPEFNRLILESGRMGELRRELEEFGIDCLKAMRKEIKSSSSNDHERLYAISAAFQRVMEVLPRQGI